MFIICMSTSNLYHAVYFLWDIIEQFFYECVHLTTQLVKLQITLGIAGLTCMSFPIKIYLNNRLFRINRDLLRTNCLLTGPKNSNLTTETYFTH